MIRKGYEEEKRLRPSTFKVHFLSFPLYKREALSRTSGSVNAAVSKGILLHFFQRRPPGDRQLHFALTFDKAPPLFMHGEMHEN